MACKTLQQKLKEIAIKSVPVFAGMNAEALDVKNEMVISKSDANLKMDIVSVLKLAKQDKIDTFCKESFV